MANGQGAVEYLMILAMVLVIALIVVGLVLFFAQPSGELSDAEHDIYWQSQARPFTVLDSQPLQLGGACYSNPPQTGFVIVVKNNDRNRLTLKGVGINSIYQGICSSPGGSAGNIPISPGKTQHVYVLTQTYDICNSMSGESKRNDEFSLAFVYDSPYLANQVQNGSIKFRLPCAVFS